MICGNDYDASLDFIDISDTMGWRVIIRIRGSVFVKGVSMENERM